MIEGSKGRKGESRESAGGRDRSSRGGGGEDHLSFMVSGWGMRFLPDLIGMFKFWVLPFYTPAIQLFIRQSQRYRLDSKRQLNNKQDGWDERDHHLTFFSAMRSPMLWLRFCMAYYRHRL